MRLCRAQLPVSVSDFAVANADVVPWHAYAKRRGTPTRSVRDFLASRKAKGTITIENGMIVSVNIAPARPRRSSVVVTTVELVERGEHVSPSESKYVDNILRVLRRIGAVARNADGTHTWTGTKTASEAAAACRATFKRKESNASAHANSR
jgi:predicted deacylase